MIKLTSCLRPSITKTVDIRQVDNSLYFIIVMFTIVWEYVLVDCTLLYSVHVRTA